MREKEAYSCNKLPVITSERYTKIKIICIFNLYNENHFFFFLSNYVEFYNWPVLIFLCVINQNIMYKYNRILSESNGVDTLCGCDLLEKKWILSCIEYWICIHVSLQNFTTKLFIFVVVLNEWLITGMHYIDLFENQQFRFPTSHRSTYTEMVFLFWRLC